MKSEETQALQRRAHQLIPGGCHTYAKGDDQYPELAPPFLVRGEGCFVWDRDGTRYIEYGMGLRAVSLGHAYPSVLEAAYGQMRLGMNFTRPMPLEVECAEELVQLIPGAEMVKFAKNGSDVTSAAVRLARAVTGRERVAICGDHPFFSVDDWFIGTTPMCAGVPRAVQDLTVSFRYNDLDSLAGLFARHPGEIACVIMEAEKEVPPHEGFLTGVQRLCRSHGALFILDEMITGFRWHLGGAQAFYGITPDLATFGKALGNGFAVAALVGKRDLMQYGGLQHDRERVFLLSYTHGAESGALAAAKAVMRIYRTEPVIDTLWETGRRLRVGLEQAARAADVAAHFIVLGKPCCLTYATLDEHGRPSQPYRTLFLQETIRRGILAPSFVVSYTHTEEVIQQTIEAVYEALRVYRRALDEGIARYLQGRSVKPVWRRFN